ncbi:hypothetical protein IAE22_31640, partial [Bacillus sp. S34]|nr:hypothetical protein [Bacillus sp. S34]
AEVASFGLPDRVDAVFSSHEIGFTKPDVRAFRHVLDALPLGPSGKVLKRELVDRFGVREVPAAG